MTKIIIHHHKQSLVNISIYDIASLDNFDAKKIAYDDMAKDPELAQCAVNINDSNNECKGCTSESSDDSIEHLMLNNNNNGNKYINKSTNKIIININKDDNDNDNNYNSLESTLKDGNEINNKIDEISDNNNEKIKIIL